MSERIGVCGGCGMKFKVPDSFQGAQAKCKKCGGIVTISAATPASAAAKTTPAPAKPAAAKAATPSAKAAPIAKKPIAAKSAAAKTATEEAAPAGSARGAGRSSKAGASGSRRGAAAPKKDNTMMIVGIAAAVLIVGGGAFFMMTKDDVPTDASPEATTTATATPATDPAPPPVVEAFPVVEAPPVEAPKEETKAPEPTPEPPAELPSIIEFGAIGKPGVVTDEQWTAAQDAVRIAFIESSRPKQRGEAMKVLADQRVAAIGAMINGLNGLDLAQERSFNIAGQIVKGIQTVSFDVIKIPFKLDVLEMTDNIQFNARCVQNLAKYWTKEMANPEKFAEKLQTAMDKPPEDDEGN